MSTKFFLIIEEIISMVFKVIKPRSEANLNKRVSIDLFCGLGGISTGLTLSGVETILGVDSWDPACESFAHNHPQATVLNGDISKIDLEVYSEIIKKTEIDIICGGPPCQGFSLAGKRMIDDPRNDMFKYFLKVVKHIKPKWFLIENVPSFGKDQNVTNEIYEYFLSSKSKVLYETKSVLLNAVDFGVPQNRKRIFFIGRREDINEDHNFNIDALTMPKFVSADESNLFELRHHTNFDDSTSDLPLINAGEGNEVQDYKSNCKSNYQKLMRGYISIEDFMNLNTGENNFFKKSTSIIHHVAANHGSDVIERFKVIPQGGSKEYLVKHRPDLLPPDGHPNQGLTYGRLWGDKPSGTIPANYSTPSGNRSIHPHQARIITPREALRLSSFPDSTEVKGGRVEIQEQIGNAVPPLLAYFIGNFIFSND
jgi:DNA-cytosine methyltransferase